MAAPTDVTVGEMRRLVAALRAAVPGWAAPGGASETSLRCLRDAFAPSALPEELLAALSVMDGSPDEGPSPFMDDGGRFLSCKEIVAETAERRETSDACRDDGEGGTWSASFVVIVSGGWSFQALLAGARPRRRSAVIDLSYDNPNHDVSCASLTALIAASADAWEAGLHPSQIWTAEEWLASQDPDRGTEVGETRYRSALRHLDGFVHRREDEYPGDDGLSYGDAINWRPWAWPLGWQRPADAVADLPDVVPVGEMPARPGDPHRAISALVEGRVGRWLHVSDDSGFCWVSLPPGLEKGHDVQVGDRVVIGVEHLGHEVQREAPTQVRAAHALQLRGTGVFEVRGRGR